MNKKKQRLILTVWLSVAAVSRILYLFLTQGVAVDTYAYCANAIAGTGKSEPVLTSGLAYAYMQKLSNLLGLFGNDSIWVAAYQTVLQIAWLVLLFFGVRYLWGEVAGYITGTVLMISPFMLQTIKVIEPVNFLLFHFGILLFLYSVFCDQTAKRGWYRSNAGELFLMLIGFYMGVVCTWNYIGFLLLPVMVYVLARNQAVLSEKLWMQKNIALEEKEQLMPIGSQGFILVAGMLVGMFATLMKYTGLTGWTVWVQLFWWQDQLAAFPGRCQDVPPAALLWLLAAFAIGIGSQVFVDYFKRKQEEKREYEELLRKEEEERRRFEAIEREAEETLEDISDAEDEPEMITDAEDDMGDEEMQDEYFTTKDGRVVKFIDNPLPGPKKHVKREMNFEIDDVTQEEKMSDDFDYKVDTDKDFDFY